LEARGAATAFRPDVLLAGASGGPVAGTPRRLDATQEAAFDTVEIGAGPVSSTSGKLAAHAPLARHAEI
jgi:hypothetical protein